MRRETFTLYQKPHEKQDNELEGKYWDDFTPLSSFTYSKPSCIKFSPTQKQTFAVCSEMNVFIHTSTESTPKVISRHKDFVYTCEYRKDGALLATGCKDGKVRLFDSSNKSLLRTFQSSKSGIRTLCWGNDCLYTAGDDMTIKCWDFTVNETKTSYKVHKDSIRSITLCPSNPFLIASGSYDHTIVLYDIRSNNSISVLKHNNPIENITFHPIGTLIAAANGQMVSVWDSTAGELINENTSHSDIVRNVLFDSEGQRLFSSSLDNTINVYETVNYDKLHTISYTSPVLSFDLNKDSTSFVVGLNNNEVILFNKQQKVVPQESIQTTSSKYFIQSKTQNQISEDRKVIREKSAVEKEIITQINHFNYDDALDKALATKDEIIIISIIREILYRNGLKIALSKRDENTLEPLITFLINTIPNPLHTKILVEVMSQLLDLYASELGKSVVFDEMFFKMQKRLEKEIQLNKSMQQLLGQIDLIIGSADCARSKTDFN